MIKGRTVNRNANGRDKKIVVIYHGDCPDGFSGAWAAWKKFGNNAGYIPAHHGDPFPAGIENKEVFLVDFVPDEATIRKLISDNKSVFPIDHHITNEVKMRLFNDYVFDMNKSGAVLAWEHFHTNEPTPDLLRYIQDIDLWRWQLPNSKETSAFIDLADFNFKTWDELVVTLGNPDKKSELVAQGHLLLKYQDKIINYIIKENAELVEFEKYKTLAVNSSVFHSQIGNNLVKMSPPIGIIWHRTKNDVNVSLRSDGNVDVSAIAKKYGGGGHKATAGFEVPLDKSLPWKPVNPNT